MEEIKTKPFEEYSYEEFNNLWKKAKIELNDEKNKEEISWKKL